jgi:SAM-dependent methyltransferase
MRSWSLKQQWRIILTNMADNHLNATTSGTRKHWDARYAQGNTPWDTQITPPEVVGFWHTPRLSRQGLALDMGCGPGTNVRYLASLGLRAIGVELASAPLFTARNRLQQSAPELLDRTHFVCSDVCLLPFQKLNVTYILDVGCLHTLPRVVRPSYVESVLSNLAPGGYYHLYAFDADPNNPEPVSGPPGMDIDEISHLFTPDLILVEEIVARPDRRPCRWYLLQRPA